MGWFTAGSPHTHAYDIYISLSVVFIGNYRRLSDNYNNYYILKRMFINALHPKLNLQVEITLLLFWNSNETIIIVRLDETFQLNFYFTNFFFICILLEFKILNVFSSKTI